MGKKKKLGFALGSGGSRGVAHIGFLQAMDEAGIKPDFLTGCSMGSVVGAAYASGMPPFDMQEIVCRLKPIDLLDVTIKPGGLFDTRKVRKVLTKALGDISFSELKIPFRCVAVDMYSQSVAFSEAVDAVVLRVFPLFSNLWIKQSSRGRRN
ncbi:MAG: patatin-like phospholipase family protein [Christensenellaceae bacterium]